MTQSFRCTSCAAPLEIEDAVSHVIRCDYCGSASKFSSDSAIFQLDFGIDLLHQARRLKEIKHLAVSGKILPAVKLYCETFGAGLAEAKEAVENIRKGKPLVFTSTETFPARNFSRNSGALINRELKLKEIRALIEGGNKLVAIKSYREAFGTGLKESKDAVEAMERGENAPFRPERESAAVPNYQLNSPERKTGISFPVKLFIAVILLFIMGSAAIYFIKNAAVTSVRVVSDAKPTLNSPVKTPVEEPKSFAREVFKFGGEGTGAGRFKDNRVVAVDSDGRLYSADISGGRIQIFDRQGNFQTQVMADPAKTIDEIAVDRKGNLFVLQGYDLHRLELGNVENHTKTRIDYASDMAIGLDGKIYVAARRGGITILSTEGKILRKIQTENSGLRDVENLAMDGTGNFYAIDGESFSVFKLSPEGKFITRFGGKSSEVPDKIPAGLFYGRPHDIAVDAMGRVYVSQIIKITVFDSQGVFLGDFKSMQAFGMAFNERDELFVATRPFITKYEIEN